MQCMLVYADVFEHPPPRLASRRPIFSDVNNVCGHNYAVERGLVIAFCGQPHLLPTPLSDSQVSISLVIHGLWWTVAGQVKAHIVLTCTNGVSPNHLVIVASDRPWTTLLTRAQNGIKIWRWAESTPRSGWWRSHIAGIYSDCSTREMNKQCSSCYADLLWWFRLKKSRRNCATLSLSWTRVSANSEWWRNIETWCRSNSITPWCVNIMPNSHRPPDTTRRSSLCRVWRGGVNRTIALNDTIRYEMLF